MASDEETKSASQRVWALPELAELIFLELPPREILVNVQRTCRQWKAIVDGSTAAQQALFFKPISDQRLHYEAWGVKSYEFRQTREFHKFRECKTLEGVRPVASPFSITDPGCGCQLVQVILSDPAMAYPAASCRRQLLTQPPLAEYIAWESGNHSSRLLKLEGAKSGVMTAQMADQCRTGHKCWRMQGQRQWQIVDWKTCSAHVVLSEMGKLYEYSKAGLSGKVSEFA